jgi:RNA polymerase sigma-70 factor (ECF subfamily)
VRVSEPESTCWTLVEHAAVGDPAAREEFGRRYFPVVRAYLKARWRARLTDDELEDAMQDVFVSLFGETNVLAKAERDNPSGFRALLYAVAHNTALRVEHARLRKLDAPGSESFRGDENETTEETLSRAFDRGWAEALVREAALLQEESAREAGSDATRRFELLRLQFKEGLSIAEIAARWNVAAEPLYKEATRAKREFKEALRRVVAFHHPHAPEAVERECRALILLFG